MNLIFTTLKKILFWCYERGTWQYDLLCVLILAFIFLAPNWIFNRAGRSSPDHAVATRQVMKGAPERDASRESVKDNENSPTDQQHQLPNDGPRD
jgi:hypothetical protein